MTERPQRHVYINDNKHVKYGETNEKQGFCLTCGEFSPCPHNALIDQYEAWENENPRLERLELNKLTDSVVDCYTPLEGEGNADHYRRIILTVYNRFGQPNDAVSVPTVDEIIKIMSDHSNIDGSLDPVLFEDVSWELLSLITRKLKGQDNEAK